MAHQPIYRLVRRAGKTYRLLTSVEGADEERLARLIEANNRWRALENPEPHQLRVSFSQQGSFALPPPPPVQRREGRVRPALEHGQQFIDLHTDPPATRDVGVGDAPARADAETQIQSDDLLVPTAPPVPLHADRLDEARRKRFELHCSLRPAAPFMGNSSEAGYNCEPNKDFSTLPKFYPSYFRPEAFHGPWCQFKTKLVNWFKSLPGIRNFITVKGQCYPKIEQDLYAHLLLEMAFTSHTCKSLAMLKARARRYLGAYDLSGISSAEYYDMIVSTCLAAYFTPGVGDTIHRAASLNNKKNVSVYEAELEKLFS